MTPTPAEREKAREIVAASASDALDLQNAISTALAAARAQGWREGIEVAANSVRDMPEIAAAIRNLSPQEPQDAT